MIVFEQNKLDVADIILTYVKRLVNDFTRLNEDVNDYICIDTYSNGREIGYALSNREMIKVAFSEYRNTDGIVVYSGAYSDFCMQGNVPNEKVYEAKKFFAYDQERAAALHIAQILLGKHSFPDRR